MNDDHTLSAVKDRLAEVRDSLREAHPSIPAGEIIARARRRRVRRRLIPGMTGALANIKVSIHELRNPAGLQRRLRADGVPATVTFVGQQNPACRPWPGAGVYGRHTSAGNTLFSKVFPADPGAPSGVIVIRPSALPSGGGVKLEAALRGHGPRAFIEIGAGLVHASQRCTGS